MVTISDVFVNLINEHQGILHKICRVYATTEDDRRDLFQEILLNAWKSFPKYEFRAKFSTWLYRVALNTALMGKRKWTPPSVDTEAVWEQVAQPESADGEEIQMLYRAIETLNSTDKALILLYLDELSYRDISDVMGLTDNHVGVRINRIKKRLAKVMESYEPAS